MTISPQLYDLLQALLIVLILDLGIGLLRRGDYKGAMVSVAVFIDFLTQRIF